MLDHRIEQWRWQQGMQHLKMIRHREYSLAGRSARQGDLGSVQVFVCEDDELLKRFPPGGKGWTGELIKKFVPLSWRIKRSQQRASQVSYVQRKSVLRADQWADESLLFGFRVI